MQLTARHIKEYEEMNMEKQYKSEGDIKANVETLMKTSF